jgi:dihydroflavonol-4-reductase
MERELERQVALGLDAVTVLPGGCLGPGDARLGTGGLLVGTVRGALPWMVDGRVHVVDVRDVAQAHLRAAQAADAGARFVLSGHEHKLSELLERVARRFGGRAPAERLDAEAGRQRADAEERAAEPTKGRVPMPRELVDIINWGVPLSSARAAAQLGFAPRPLNETLDDAHAWFQRMKYVPREGQEVSTQP